VGASGRRTITAPAAPAARVPDPQILLPVGTSPSSMFVDGEVPSVAQDRPSLQNALQIDEPAIVIEDLDEAKCEHSTFPTLHWET
jgi:hypothetical protein